MAAVTELQVVNACLASLGESPLQSLEDYHPYIAAARQILADALQTEQANKWWFGFERTTLEQDPDTGEVFVPADTIDIRAISSTQNLVQRGRRLYNVYTGTYNIGEDVTCVLVRELPLEDMPLMAQHMVKAAAVLRFQTQYDAEPTKTAQLQQEYLRYRTEVGAEDIRQVDANLLLRTSTAMVRQVVLGGNTSTFLGR